MEQGARARKKLIAAVLFALLAVYLVFHAVRILKKDIPLVAASPYTLSETIRLDGAFFDEATLVSAAKKGVAVTHFEIGEKAAAGAVLADIYPEKQRKNAEKLSSVLHQIRVLEEGARQNSGDEALRERLDAALASLKNEKDVLLSALGAPSETVITEVSGYVYPANGYETTFSAADVTSLSAEVFDAKMKAPAATFSTPTFAVITDHRRTFVCKASQAVAADLEIGKEYPCLESEVILRLTEKRDGDGVLLFFSLSSGQKKLTSGQGSLLAELRRQSGLRIPKSALRQTDGEAFVFIFSRGTAKRRAVQIIGEAEDFYLVSTTFESPSGSEVLRQNDLVISRQKGLYDGKPIH